MEAKYLIGLVVFLFLSIALISYSGFTPTTGMTLILGDQNIDQNITQIDLNGAAAFTDLNDTLDSYSGFALDCVIVNSDENGLTFSACGTGGGADTTLDVNMDALFSFLSKSYDWNADQNFLSVNIKDANFFNSGFFMNNDLNYSFLDLNISVINVCAGDTNSFLNNRGECIKITDFNGTGSGGGTVDANGSFLQSFTDGDLTNGIIRVSHDLNNTYPSVTVFDSNELIILPDRVLFVDANTVDINLLNFVPLVGTWNAKIITRAGTGVTASSTSGFTADFNNFDLTDGILTVTHDLTRPYPQAVIYNDLNKNILPDGFENITVNQVDVNLLNYVPINGLWRVRITANN